MIGKCRLCLRDGIKLLQSHFMPAALYKIVRDDRFKVAHPVHVTRDVTMHSPRQASDYLLCAECERRFEQGGETWVIPRCWQNTTTFPLRDSLVTARPVPATDAGVAIYDSASIPNVDVDKLAYFATSVFWRAAAHEWSLHQQTVPRLRLGVYEEELRRYLLGAPFPKAIVFTVLVAQGMEEMRNALVTFPYMCGRDKRWRQYACTIPASRSGCSWGVRFLRRSAACAAFVHLNDSSFRAMKWTRRTCNAASRCSRAREPSAHTAIVFPPMNSIFIRRGRWPKP